MSAIGVVTGSRAEAAWLGRRADVEIAVVGGDPILAAAATRRLVAAGAEVLMSFGLAGGLDPDLGAGDLVVASAVVDGHGGRWPADAGIAAALREQLPDRLIVTGTVLGATRPATTPAAKARLYAATGACAIDMESQAVAAGAEGRPLVVLRAIADHASRAVPSAALAALGSDGRLHLGRMLATLARKPGELPALVGLANEWRAGRRALKRAGPLALALLGGRRGV